MHNGSLGIVLVFLLAAVIAVPLFRKLGLARCWVISRRAWRWGRRE